MNNEASLNTVISNSFFYISNIDQRAKCIKIADPVGGTGIQNPFDHFGVFNSLPLYSESKLLKNKIQSFSFNKIEKHQFENLDFFSKALNGNCYTLVWLGIYIPHKLKIVMIFDFQFLYKEFLSGKKSFLKKELEEWIKKDFFLPINYKKVVNKENKESRLELIEGLDRLDLKIIRGYEC